MSYFALIAYNPVLSSLFLSLCSCAVHKIKSINPLKHVAEVDSKSCTRLLKIFIAEIISVTKFYGKAID